MHPFQWQHPLNSRTNTMAPEWITGGTFCLQKAGVDGPGPVQCTWNQCSGSSYEDKLLHMQPLREFLNSLTWQLLLFLAWLSKLTNEQLLLSVDKFYEPLLPLQPLAGFKLLCIQSNFYIWNYSFHRHILHKILNDFFGKEFTLKSNICVSNKA